MAAGILGEYVLKHPVEIGVRENGRLFPEPLEGRSSHDQQWDQSGWLYVGTADGKKILQRTH